MIGLGHFRQSPVELQGLEKFLQRFQVYKLNEPVADLTVKLLTRFRLSHGLLIPDTLIAATALSFNIPFVSRNQRDYHFIPDLEYHTHTLLLHKPDRAILTFPPIP